MKKVKLGRPKGPDRVRLAPRVLPATAEVLRRYGTGVKLGVIIDDMVAAIEARDAEAFLRRYER